MDFCRKQTNRISLRTLKIKDKKKKKAKRDFFHKIVIFFLQNVP